VPAWCQPVPHADSPQHRPLAQAAAWALFDRVVAGKATLEDPRLLEAASDADHVVAGPLLLAFGIVTGAERQELLARLDRRGLSDRAELIRIAAAAANTLPPLGASHRHRLLSRLAAGETLDDLDAAEREELCAWSRSL